MKLRFLRSSLSAFFKKLSPGRSPEMAIHNPILPDHIPNFLIPRNDSNNEGGSTLPRSLKVVLGQNELSCDVNLSAEFVFAPRPAEPPADLANNNHHRDISFGSDPDEESVIEISKYNFSLLTPFDCPKSQSPESPDNSHLHPRYEGMIFFDPQENCDSPRDQSDHRRKKFLTVISANSISTPASPGRVSPTMAFMLAPSQYTRAS
jgi:hypothetical protein